MKDFLDIIANAVCLWLIVVLGGALLRGEPDKEIGRQGAGLRNVASRAVLRPDRGRGRPGSRQSQSQSLECTCDPCTCDDCQCGLSAESDRPTARQPTAPPIAWLSSLDEAYARARETGRPVLVHWTADGCAPCAVMDREVFADGHVAGAINNLSIPVRINTSRRPDLAREYGVTRVPADHLLSADWRRRRVLRPCTGAADFARELERAGAWAEDRR